MTIGDGITLFTSSCGWRSEPTAQLATRMSSTIVNWRRLLTVTLWTYQLLNPCHTMTKQCRTFIVGDDAFALRTWLQKPLSLRLLTMNERIYNYRLSRARRVVENAFGILANRFRCLYRTLQQRPTVVTSIVLACVCLHNMLQELRPNENPAEMDHEDDDHSIVPGSWRQFSALVDGHRDFGNHTSTKAAKNVRTYLSENYSSDMGSVPWQDDMIWTLSGCCLFKLTMPSCISNAISSNDWML